MTKKSMKLALGVAAAVASLCAAPTVSAAGVVNNTTTIQLSANGGQAGGGGQFLASIISGPGASFETYCLEGNENISFASVYSVTVNTVAVKGGISSSNGTLAALGGGVFDNFIGSPVVAAPTTDPLSFATAYLYTQFVNNVPTFLAGTAALKNSMQQAIWFMEGERSAGLGTATYAGLSAQAKTWIGASYLAVNGGGTCAGFWGCSLGNVKVLNLAKAGTPFAQDMIYLSPVPEPETYAMMLAGLGLMGFVARRRKQRAGF